MTGDSEIRELDRTTIERIAAGEVVERPASVVKELVENSLDADAGRIAVEVENGGVDRVRVSDDGVGMSETDLRLSVRPHTTSKLRDADDLAAGVETLGFRGEALNTIGAVSRTTITSKPRDSTDAGAKLRLAGGEVGSVEAAGCPAGTTVDVRDLFYNTPAREKYLGATSTEFAHVNTVVTQYALANPDVAVSLEHNGREVFATTGQGDLAGTVLSVYGREVATSMVEVDGAGSDGPLERLRGYVSHPETTRSSREYVSTYVNGRYVTDATAREAVVDAYGTQLASDRYPFAVLFLELPADAVDVNVHPRKMAVRFEDEDGVRRQVRTAVERALLDDGLVRSSAPRGRSAPEQAEIAPERETSTESRDPAVDDDGASSVSAVDASPDESPTPASRPGDAAGDPAERRASRGTTDDEPADDCAPDGDSTDGEPAGSGATNHGSAGDRSSPASERRFAGATEQTTFGGTGDREFDGLPSLRVLGQLDDTYVVAETDDGLALVDQHAADERVNYERLCEAIEDDATAQALAEPVALELTAGEAASFETHREALARLGFRAEREGERTVRVTAVPAVFDETLDPGLLRDALSEFVSTDSEERGHETVDAAVDALLADLACYPSITGNTSLTDGSVVALLSALDDCENPYACPHGRPVVIELSRAELDERFERDYPGHGGRRPT